MLTRRHNLQPPISDKVRKKLVNVPRPSHAVHQNALCYPTWHPAKFNDSFFGSNPFRP